MANIGKYNTLSVIAVTDKGAYLDGGELGEVLLPNRFMPENCAVDDKLKVFIYGNISE